MNTLIVRYACLFVSAILLSLALTPIVREIMRKLGVVDKPNARRVNKRPIPRGGGLAVVVTFFLLVTIYHLCFPQVAGDSPISYEYFLAGAGVLVLMGLADDIFGLTARMRLFIEIGVALFFWFNGVQFTLPSIVFGAFATSPWVTLPLTVMWYVVVVNAFNLIDGLDGLSSGLAIIAQLGICGIGLLTGNAVLVPMTLVFIGALLGFLRYNYHPASIFLGDSGSLFLGVSIATSSLIIRRPDSTVLLLLLPILCMGVPIMDTLLAILRRSVRAFYNRSQSEGELSAVMTADKDHLHHRFLKWMHGNQKRAVWMLYGLAILLSLCGGLVYALHDGKMSFFILGIAALGAVLVRLMADVELFNIGQVLTTSAIYEGDKEIMPVVYLLIDLLSMIGAFVFTIYFFPKEMLQLSWLQLGLLFIAYSVPVIICLFLSKSYVRIWDKSTRKDSFYILVAIVLGSLIAQFGINLFEATWARNLLKAHMLWTLILPFPLLLVRFLQSIFLQYVAFSENRKLRNESRHNKEVKRVICYGAGLTLRAYLIYHEMNVTRNQVALVGALDDNVRLHGLIYRDIRILGALEILEDEAFLKRLRPTHLVLTSSSLTAVREQQICDFCKAHHITVSKLVIEESLFSAVV